MTQPCERYQVLISGYLDGELSSEDRSDLEAHLDACTACRRECDAMQRLAVGTAAAFAREAPPEDVWDGFVNGVYNRLERRSGWLALTAGALLLPVYGIYHFLAGEWANALVKVLIAAPIIGLGILFVSVLRQRLRAARTDRYSREVRH